MIKPINKHIELNNTIDEFDVYSEYFEEEVLSLNKNVQEIIEWGFTEILNNAIDHSNAKNVFIDLTQIDNEIILAIADDGIGIIENIKTQKNIKTNSTALLELLKGKLTTDIENHTGLGIFFSLHAFDKFAIFSNGEYYQIKGNNIQNNSVNNNISSSITMIIKENCSTHLKDIFDNFSPAPEFEFTKTIIPMKLINKKQKLISRSQAKQVVHRLNEFEYVIFDFQEVESIGQGFADEIFRVYQQKNTITLEFINASEEVESMIKRVINYK